MVRNGKARAHNTGVANCKNELFYCVDSDDYLPNMAVEVILNSWQPVRYDPGIAGIIGLRGKDGSTPLTTAYQSDLKRITLWDLYYKHGYKGDTALIYRAELLALFPFKIAEGERFMAETFVYHQIGQYFEMSVLNEIVYVCSYLPDGYTANARKVTRQNPRSYAMHKRRMVEYSDTFIRKFENSVLYMVGCVLGDIKGGVRNAPSPAIAALAYLPARMLCVTVYRDKG